MRDIPADYEGVWVFLILYLVFIYLESDAVKPVSFEIKQNIYKIKKIKKAKAVGTVVAHHFTSSSFSSRSTSRVPPFLFLIPPTFGVFFFRFC